MAFSSFKNKFLRKRNIVIALIVIEIASFPAAAKMLERLSVSEAPTASVVLIDAIKGRKRFAVASNAPFYISVNDVVGNVTVKIHKSGQIGQARFGDNAQMPGVALVCSTLTGEERVLYQSKRKTSLNQGEILSQAVIVAIHFEKSADPDFTIDVGTSDSRKAKSSVCLPKLV